MKLLLAFDQRHPVVTASIGSFSGFAAWFIAHASQVSSIAGAIGASASALISVLTLTRLFTGKMRQWKRNREQRRKWKRHEPFDDHLP